MEKTIQLPYDLAITFLPVEDLVAEGSRGLMAVTAVTIKYQRGLSAREKYSIIFHELLETAKAAFGLELKHDDIETLDQFLALTCLELGITLDLPEDDPVVPGATTVYDPTIPFTLT